jgi:hypothetical protein
MPNPVYIGSAAAPEDNDSPGLQQWMAREYPIATGRDPRARELRLENARRFLAYLARCPRATRTS